MGGKNSDVSAEEAGSALDHDDDATHDGGTTAGDPWETAAVDALHDKDRSIADLLAEIRGDRPGKRPEAPDGMHYSLNPNTGQIGLEKDMQLDIYRHDPADAKTRERGWHYAVNPQTGKIGPAPNIVSGPYRPSEHAWEERGYRYGLNPRTGSIDRYKTGLVLQ